MSLEAEVTLLMEGRDDRNATFLIEGEDGAGVFVVTSDPPPELLTTDGRAIVTGIVRELEEVSFEENFGLAPEEAFADPAEVFGNQDRPVAIDAIEVALPSQS